MLVVERVMSTQSSVLEETVTYSVTKMGMFVHLVHPILPLKPLKLRNDQNIVGFFQKSL